MKAQKLYEGRMEKENTKEVSMSAKVSHTLDPFLEAERKLVEVSSLMTSQYEYMNDIGDTVRKVSGCDGFELRNIFSDLSYKWFRNYSTLQFKISEMKCRTMEDELVPASDDDSPLEAVILDLFQKNHDPKYHFERKLYPLYIEDTSVPVSLGNNGSAHKVDLSVTGFASILLLPFKILGNPPSIVIIYSHTKHFINKSEVKNYESMAYTFSIAVKFRRDVQAYNERSKELNCLFDISLMVLESNNQDVMLQKIVERIPEGVQYPHLASARIDLNGTIYKSKQAVISDNFIQRNYKTETSLSLTIAIYYRDPGVTDMPAIFLNEEQQMLDILVSRLIIYIERDVQKQELKAMEEKLRHADRLATIGKLSSSIAHDLNNPMANILGYAQLLLKTVKTPAVRADLEKIVRSTEQAKETVGKLLSYARKEQVIKKRMSLNKILENSLDLLKIRLEQGKVKLNLELDPKLPELEADSSQMIQVVTNLCTNALQAMPKGGKLTIRTAPAQGKISLSIIDTGVGIQPENLDKIFTPFYSTKSIGEGTGLGLFVVHSIIESYNGSITVNSTPGQGSRFDISLPVRY